MDETLNHDEAGQLAVANREKSNLARCYLDLELEVCKLRSDVKGLKVEIAGRSEIILIEQHEKEVALLQVRNYEYGTRKAQTVLELCRPEYDLKRHQESVASAIKLLSEARPGEKRVEDPLKGFPLGKVLGEINAMKRNDEGIPLCVVQVGCFGQCGKLMPCEDHPPGSIGEPGWMQESES